MILEGDDRPLTISGSIVENRVNPQLITSAEESIQIAEILI